jgi:hypothetical protein
MEPGSSLETTLSPKIDIEIREKVSEWLLSPSPVPIPPQKFHLYQFYIPEYCERFHFDKGFCS